MPLYTYVLHYKGETYVTQRRRSNFQGFADWLEGLPASVRKGIKHPYAGFEPVPNRQRVWQRSLMVDDRELVVTAVQSD